MFLDFILRIEYAEASQVSAIFRQESLTECSISGLVNWRRLEIKVPAKMSVEEEIRDKQIFRVTTVTFQSKCAQIDANQYCLRLTLHNGKKMLVGNGKRPHLVGLCKKVHPDNTADSQLYEFTVKWVSTIPPLMVDSI